MSNQLTQVKNKPASDSYFEEKITWNIQMNTQAVHKHSFDFQIQLSASSHTTYPEIPLDRCPLLYGSDLVLLHRPLSRNPHRLRFESATQYGWQLATWDRGVPMIIT